MDARNMGVGSGPGTLTFTSSLDTVNHVVDASYSGPAERVEVATLDALVGDRSPAFVKIDVEGHEDAVLEGARETLAKPELLGLILEVNGQDPSRRAATKAVVAAGFGAYHYDPFARCITPSEPRPGNTVYLRNVELVERRLREAPRRQIAGVDV